MNLLNPYLMSPHTIVAMAQRAQMKDAQIKDAQVPAHNSEHRGRCLKCRRKLSGKDSKTLCHCEEKGEDTIEEEYSSPIV